MRQLDYRYAWLLLCTYALAGCQGANPIRAAETPEQRAYAAYGTFVIFQERAAIIAEQENIPRDIRLRIIAAEERAKPTADSLMLTLLEFIRVKAEFDTAVDEGDPRLVALTGNLNDWINQLLPLVNELIRNVSEADE